MLQSVVRGIFIRAVQSFYERQARRVAGLSGRLGTGAVVVVQTVAITTGLVDVVGSAHAI